MNVKQFMENNSSIIISDVLSQLSNEFNSHEFIQKFSKRFELDYISFLYYYRKKESFKTVHSQIAKFLSVNSKVFNISKSKKVTSKNIFGESDEIQSWIKN